MREARDRNGQMTFDRPRIATDLEINEVEDGLIVYQESLERVHHLNPTASVVFQLCDGSHDSASIAAIIKQVYGLDAEPYREVESCLSRFIQEGLVR